eukprot:scaffold957_cov402-Prasinococcus_capsulatus_cf.AAC.21
MLLAAARRSLVASPKPYRTCEQDAFKHVPAEAAPSDISALTARHSRMHRCALVGNSGTLCLGSAACGENAKEIW